MPVGVLVTAPLPVPVVVTVRMKVGVKVAVTVVVAVRVRVQEAVPVQPPLQPVKAEPAAGVAVSVTSVPVRYVPEQSVPHVIPAGVLVTVPLPAPLLVTVRMKVGVKVAVTVVAAVRVTVQEAIPVQPPPLHPVKAESVAGVAVGGTTVP